MNTTRPAPNRYSEIFHLLDRAFAPSISESNLVRDLHDRGKIVLDRIIEQDSRVLAYICYSAAFDSVKNPIGFHLAPLAVLPGLQRRGLGQQITGDSLKLLPKGMPVYVLGDPGYYKRFGFRIDRSQKCAFDPDGNHFMVYFNGKLSAREVMYEEEFYELA